MGLKFNIIASKGWIINPVFCETNRKKNLIPLDFFKKSGIRIPKKSNEIEKIWKKNNEHAYYNKKYLGFLGSKNQDSSNLEPRFFRIRLKKNGCSAFNPYCV